MKRIGLRDFGITIGVRNPSSDWNSVPGIRIHDVESGMQDNLGFLYVGRKKKHTTKKEWVIIFTDGD